MDTDKTIPLKDGIKLRRIREFLGIKQIFLAKEIGVSQPKMALIENEECIGIDLLTEIANALGVRTEVIINFDENDIVWKINHHNELQDNSTNDRLNPIDKIVELYERLIASEKEKRELLKSSSMKRTRISDNKYLFVEPQNHIGKNITGIRLLRGMSQAELGQLLGGITKQAVSKLEQSEKLNKHKMLQVANALGITVEGLKCFKKEIILSTPQCINKNHSDKINCSRYTNIKTNSNQSLVEIIMRFEKMIKIEGEKFEKVYNQSPYKHQTGS